MKYDKETGLVEANSGDTVSLVYQEKPNESLTISIPTQSQNVSEDIPSQDELDAELLKAKPFNITLFNPSSKRGRVNLFKLHEIIGEANTKRLVDKLDKLPIYSNNAGKLVLEGKDITTAPVQCQYMIKELQSAQKEYDIEQKYLHEYTKQQIQKEIQKETKLTEELLNKEKNINFHK